MSDHLDSLVSRLAADLAATGAACETRSTHISLILLTPDHAYKFKRPVDFGFVDFSTLERRRHFCEREVELNRRFAPALYEGVVPVTGSAAAPRLGGDGAAIEFAVSMRRFDEARIFAAALDRGALDAAHFRAFGRRLAALHAAAPAAGIASDFGSADLVAAQLRGSLEHLAGVDAADGLPAAVGRMLERQRTRLMARKADGRVRECHGDLHLGNVLLGEDGAVLFDCIEFSDELRIIDTMSDLAFLVMDLDCRGHDDFANALLNEYLDESGDYAGICVLDLYCAYRALVRAKVAELQRRGGGGEELAPRRDAYLEHARAWLGPRGRPGLVITCGVAGSGKSHRAAALAAGSGFVHLRSDRERRRLGPDEGADPQRYSAARTAATYTRLYDLAATILAAGHSVVVDATFLERHWRRRFAALANDARAQFHILHCDAPPAVLTERIEARRREGRDLSEATVGVMQAQLERLEPFADDERGAVLAAGDLGAASALGCPRSPAAMAPMAHRARHGHG